MADDIELGRGQRIGNLTIHSRLGGGAMGTAHLASHPILWTPFVVKTFRGGPNSEVFAEAHLAARVRAQHVVGAVDAGFVDDVPYIVLPYVDGIDLQELIGRVTRMGRSLSIELVTRLVHHAALGLMAIHQAGIVHRDIKPANLFLYGNGEAAVGDFGIALQRKVDMSNKDVTGTPQFMSPELWRTDRIDERADIYALGATAHCLVSGAPPFSGATIEALAMAHMEQPYLPPRARSPREAYFVSAIDRMLSKAPSDRFQSAGAVVRCLSTILEPAPTLVPIDDRTYRVGPVTIELRVDDIARARADVIVNAANPAMKMDTGVGRAIRIAGGQVIATEAQAQAPASMGTVCWTSAGDLDARAVAHAVAALGGAMTLQRCMLRLLIDCESRHAGSVAIPALGTGEGEVPMELSAKLMIESVRTFATFEPFFVRQLMIVLYDEDALESFQSVMRTMTD